MCHYLHTIKRTQPLTCRVLQIIAIAIFIIDRFFTQFEEKQYFWSLRKFNFLLTISNSIFNYLILFSTILSTDTICCFISLVVCSLYLVSLAIVVVDIVIVGVASVVVVTYTPYFPLGSCWFDYTGQRLPRMESRG